MRSLLYVMAFAACWVGCTLIPKVERRVNAVSMAALSYVSVLCYGAAGALMLKLMAWKVSLENVTAFYTILAFFFWVIIIYKRKIQHMEYRICDAVGLIAGVIVIGAISIHIFTPYLHLNYNNMVDPSGHFYYAMSIIRSENVSGMYFTQFHNAMFMQILIPFLPKAWSYKAFILADCYHTLIEYCFFYGFIIYLLRNKKHNKYVPVILALLYWLGYPLYSFAGGAYVYWAMGAMLVFYVFWLLKVYEDAKERNVKVISTVLIVLGCFSTTMCYVQFAPIVVFATLVVYMYQMLSRQQFVLKRQQITQMIVIVCVGVIIACLGYYFIFYRTGLNLFEGLAGGINTGKNLEMLCMIPIAYFIIYKKCKEKDLNAYILTLLCLTIFHIAMILLSTLEVVSSYYLFKDNYILWGMIFIVAITEYPKLDNKEKRYSGHYIALISLLLLFMYLPQKQLETTDTLSIDNSIYKHNATLFVENDFRHAAADECINMIEYVAESYDYTQSDETVLLVGTNWYKGVCHWYSGITGQPYFFQSPINPDDVNYALKDKDADYIMVYYGSEAYLMAPEYFDSFEKVYDTSDGFIGKVKQ